MLADNIIFLKKNYPELYEELKKNEVKDEESIVTIEEAKDGNKTIKIKQNGNNLYLHSKYNPLREAESIINSLEEREEIDNQSHVIFYGIGLGYHIDSFIKRYPETMISLYEPSIEVFKKYLSLKNLNRIKPSRINAIQCEFGNKAMKSFFNSLLNKNDKKMIIMDLPSYQNAFASQYTQFKTKILDVIQQSRSSLNTNYAFKKRWILNSVVNFKEVLNTPSILIENNEMFKDKTCFLVSAGPSLDYEIENLRRIKKEGLGYIFSVGSSINTLIQNHINPDAMCTYDPTFENQNVFELVYEMDITNIPMIFGSSVGFETLKKYKGPKFHMVTTQDTVSNYFLKVIGKSDLLKISDAPSIAVVTIELLYKLKFKEIVLVGQNLAYFDEKYYSSGVPYQMTINQEKEDDLLKTVDVNGNEIFTNEGFSLMKNQMEALIEHINVSIINSTIGGAQIKGTQFISLNEIIKELQKSSETDIEELTSISYSKVYDSGYLYQQLQKMETEYEKYQKLLQSINLLLIKAEELIMNKNASQASVMYNKIDNLLVKLESNDFSIVFALPMHRVEHKILAKNVQQIKSEKRELIKIQKLVNDVRNFINLLNSDTLLNKQIIETLKEYINSELNKNHIEK